MPASDELKRNIEIAGILLILMFISACTVLHLPSRGNRTFYPSVKANEIDTEISRLEQSLEHVTDYAKRTETIFRLATLYSHPNNPKPDYFSALEKYEEYSLLDPECRDATTAKYVMALITEIRKNRRLYDELKEKSKQIYANSVPLLATRTGVITDEKQVQEMVKGLEKKNRMVENENAQLKQENRQLTEQIGKMKEIIEKLKYLDIRLEKKRRNLE